MVFQVLIIFNNKNKPVDVADSLEQFEKTTILELKKKCIEKFTEGSAAYRSSRAYREFDPSTFRVIFGTDPLEDHLTLGFYKIRHLSVLLFVMKMPGGPGPNPPARFPRSESMERLYYRTMNNPNSGKSSDTD